MDIKAAFEQAAIDVKAIATRPSNENLLELYALYKQATEGDVKGSRPGILDLKGRAKYDAWSQKKGMAAPTAMESYVNYVQKLKE